LFFPTPKYLKRLQVQLITRASKPRPPVPVRLPAPAAKPQPVRPQWSQFPRGRQPQPPDGAAPRRPCNPRSPCVVSVYSLPVFLERQLAIVLAQEIQKPLVVARLHVEEFGDDLVITTRVLETLAHEVAHV